MNIDREDLIEYFVYLDALRQSGATNMFGAAEYLRDDFDITKADSKLVLTAWMQTFNGDSSAEDRADIALKDDAP